MNHPFGVATDSSGNLYVADTDNNRIQKFNSAGTWDRAWGKNVKGDGAFGVCTVASSCQAGTTGGLGGEMNGPTGVAVAGGYVYVADRLNHRIQKFDSSGNFVLTWGKNVNIFGGTGFEGCTGAAVCRAGVSGGLGGEMNVPYDVATDAVPNVYVADSGNNRVQTFNSEGTWNRAWGKNVNGGGAFGVCTTAASCLAGTTGELGGEMSSPKGIATDANANVYVADEVNNRIQKFDSSGSWNRAWGRDGTTYNFTICTVAANCTAVNGFVGAEMTSPDGVTTDSDANVYVADTNNHRIQKFDSAGHWDRAWGKYVRGGGVFGVCTVAWSCHPGTTGGLGGEMNLPTSAASDSSGHLYVVDYGNHRIQVFGEAPPAHSTTSAVSCAPGSLELGSGPTSCTVTVTDADAPPVPQGTVTFASNGAGFGGGWSCTLATLNSTQASCHIDYTPSAVGSGSHQITATYPGDLNHDGSQAATGVDVTPPPTDAGDNGSQTGTENSTTTTTAPCQLLRKKLKKAKTKAAKQKIRRKLRALGC